MTGRESSSTSGVEDLPPSAKYVYHVIDEADGPLTRQEIIDRTALAASTVDDALRTLESRHLAVKSRKSDDLTQVVAESRHSPDV